METRSSGVRSEHLKMRRREKKRLDGVPQPGVKVKGVYVSEGTHWAGLTLTSSLTDVQRQSEHHSGFECQTVDRKLLDAASHTFRATLQLLSFNVGAQRSPRT